MHRRLRLLQIEDSESDAELIVRQLRNAGHDVVGKRIEDGAAMRASLASSTWDLIVCDCRMPGFDATAALALLQESGRDIPFLVISGTVGEEVAAAMMKAGAHDYFMKGNLTRLAAAVERELREAKTRTERRQALSELQERDAQFTLAVDATEMGIFDYDPQTGTIFCSELTKRHLQLPQESAPSLENLLDRIHPVDRSRIEEAVETAFRQGGGDRFAEEFQTETPLGGEGRWISARGKVFRSPEGEPSRFLGIVRDITERKRAEQAMQFQLQLTARITELSTDCILLHDGAGNVLFINPEAERVFGYTLAEFQAGTPHEMLHHHYPDGRPYPLSDCTLNRHAVAGESLREHEEVLFHKNGTPIDMEISCVPLEMKGVRVGIVFTFRDITERKRTERALRQSDERFRRLFEADITGILIADGEYILESNDHFLRMLGYTREEFFAERLSWKAITPPELADASERATLLLLNTGACPAFEREYLRKDGTRVPVLFTAVDLQRPTGDQQLCFVVDLTDRKKLENQLRQAQRLESIGQLAGGVAHDFNNLLTVILGYSEMLLARIEREHPFRDSIEQISAAGNRAAGLTRQLLTFSRRNKGAPMPIPLDNLVLGIDKMLQRLIGDHIEVMITLKSEMGLIHADTGLIEQVIVNLAVNARDAMPDGGKLMIETSRVKVSDEFACLCLSVPLGLYVSLEVTDTGIGMAPEIQARLFEPFFTTKEPGRGTGLGLSAVYGIVKQSGGVINVHSSPGIGTSFRILFPAVNDTWTPAVPEPEEIPEDGTETLLLVEDETGVRNYVGEVLRAHGYRVLAASRGVDAIEISTHFSGTIDLLLTDTVMPGMSSSEMIQQFLSLHPGTPVLRMSGYPERLGAQVDEGIRYLQKPFTPQVLLTRIRKVLRLSRQKSGPGNYEGPLQAFG